MFQLTCRKRGWVGTGRNFFFFIYSSLFSKYVHCVYSNCNYFQDVAISKFGVYEYNQNLMSRKEGVKGEVFATRSIKRFRDILVFMTPELGHNKTTFKLFF